MSRLTRPASMTALAQFALAVSVAALITACTGQGAETTTTTEEPAVTTTGGDRTTSTSKAEVPPEPFGTIRVGMLTDRMSFNPHLSEIGHMLQYLQPVYDSLIRETASGELVPMLATEWSYNDDRTVLTLSLRDDVVFSDGSGFDAETVRANIEAGQASAGPRASALSNVASVEVMDPTTVEIHLSAADPMLLRELASVMGMMVSPDALANEDLDVNPVGSGPYRLVAEESSEGDRYVYEYNPDYWDPALQGVARIELVLIADAEARLNALTAGQIDMAPGDAVRVAAAEAAGLTVLSEPLNWFGLNLADREGTLVAPLADPTVRRAMNHAIDRQAIVDSVEFGLATAATQIYPVGDPANIDPEGSAFPYDPDLARSLLAEAGYSEGFTIEQPLVTFVGFAQAAEAIVGYLAEVGIEVQLSVTDAGGVFLGSWLDPANPVTLLNYGARHPDEMVRLFVLDDGSYNQFGVEVPGVRELREEAARSSEEEASAIYAEIATQVTEDAWFLVTHFKDVVYFVGPGVEGVEMYPQQAVPSIYVWQVTDQ